MSSHPEAPTRQSGQPVLEDSNPRWRNGTALTDLNFDILDRIAKIVVCDATASKRRYLPALVQTSRLLHDIVLRHLVSDVHLHDAVSARQFLSFASQKPQFARFIVKLRIHLRRPSSSFAFDMELEVAAMSLPDVLDHAAPSLQVFQLDAPWIFSFSDSRILEALQGCLKLHNLALDVHLGPGGAILGTVRAMRAPFRLLFLNCFGARLEPHHLQSSSHSLQKLSIKSAIFRLNGGIRFPAVTDMWLEDCQISAGQLSTAFPNLRRLIVGSYERSGEHVTGDVSHWKSLPQLSCLLSNVKDLVPDDCEVTVLDISAKRLTTVQISLLRDACTNANPAMVSLKINPGSVCKQFLGPHTFHNLIALDFALDCTRANDATELLPLLRRLPEILELSPDLRYLSVQLDCPRGPDPFLKRAGKASIVIPIIATAIPSLGFIRLAERYLAVSPDSQEKPDVYEMGFRMLQWERVGRPTSRWFKQLSDGEGWSVTEMRDVISADRDTARGKLSPVQWTAEEQPGGGESGAPSRPHLSGAVPGEWTFACDVVRSV